MTDIYDQATDREMRDRELALSLVRNQSTALSIKPIGVCHNCGDLVSNALTFCDSNCRDDWQLRQPRIK